MLPRRRRRMRYGEATALTVQAALAEVETRNAALLEQLTASEAAAARSREREDALQARMVEVCRTALSDPQLEVRVSESLTAVDDAQRDADKHCAAVADATAKNTQLQSTVALLEAVMRKDAVLTSRHSRAWKRSAMPR